MNQLSWLLYWGDVLGNLRVVLGILAVVACIAGFIIIVMYYDGDLYKDKKTKYQLAAQLIITSVICMIVASFAPSSTTIYAIAASEIGQCARQTPLAGKAEQALESWLTKQIKGQ